MIVIGLTGPTGAGKGEVGRCFEALGALVIDTDRVARDVVTPPSEVLDGLAAAFGADVLQADGTLNRAVLASRAFASEQAQQQLNQLTHPAIIRRTLQQIRDTDRSVAVIDAPLLFESGMDAVCDVTVAVLADEATRLERILVRDGLSKEAALARMSRQHDEAFYRDRATYTLYNNGAFDELKEAATALLHRIKEEEA